MAADVPPDELAMVYGWMRCLSNDDAAAEDWAIEVVLRYRRQVGPPWLRGGTRFCVSDTCLLR